MWWDGICASDACLFPECNCCFPDCNANGIPDDEESDSDGDGLTNDCDNCPSIPNPGQEDCQPNDVGDVCDIASGAADCNNNNVPDECEGQDCNNNGVLDSCEPDQDGDGVIDDCDNCALPNPDQADCQPNGNGDVCDIDDDISEDCNDNGIPDECDIADMTSDDEDSDGIPDECQIDTDGDGLLDDWEINGVPYDKADGSEGRVILDSNGDGMSDADPLYKDIFVEVEAMDCPEIIFGPAVKQPLIDAFADAPVDNAPGQPTGIKLHIQLDVNVPCAQPTVVPLLGPSWYDFPSDAATIKNEHFGWDFELDDVPEADRQKFREAKSKAVRFCILYKRFVRSNDPAKNAYLGLGETGGDDFVISPTFFQVCDPGGGNCQDIQDNMDLAVTFMHELGHNLGLRHGGGDTINGKPNYPSIMNYVLAHRTSWNHSFWKLDYSREELPFLNETLLDERFSVGAGTSGYYNKFRMPYFSVPDEDSDCYTIPQTNPNVWYAFLHNAKKTDFNLNCAWDDVGISGDLNYLPGSILPGDAIGPSPGQLLQGWNDWANLDYVIDNSGPPFGLAVPTDEVNEEMIEFMEENFPMPHVYTIPATSEWGLAIMGLVMLTGATLAFRRFGAA